MDKTIKEIVVSDELCDLCGTCVGVCPENVIRLTISKIIIDHEGCTRCSKCVWICPVRAMDLQEIVPAEVSVIR